MARTINPVHTPWDGDTLFAMSTGQTQTPVDVGRIGALAAEVVSQAISACCHPSEIGAGISGVPVV
jgi:L-aminopeptidase/D-esterase-like protein